MKWLSAMSGVIVSLRSMTLIWIPPANVRASMSMEVVSILGKNWFMTTVWGSAFEDFLTRDFDGGQNIVDDYLKRRGWKESASTRAYMTSLRTLVASLYEVGDITRDTSFRARDLVRGGNVTTALSLRHFGLAFFVVTAALSL
jgi:hypothetical protein